MKSYSTRMLTRSNHQERGKVYVKFFWWPLIISLAISILLTLILNILL